MKNILFFVGIVSIFVVAFLSIDRTEHEDIPFFDVDTTGAPVKVMVDIKYFPDLPQEIAKDGKKIYIIK